MDKHKKERTETTERWRKEHPERQREIWKKGNHKRRGLGSNVLNEPFEGCEGHHINFNDIICIPREIHKSIWHNLSTGKNMGLINNLAYQFLMGNYIIYKQRGERNENKDHNRKDSR